MSKPLTGAERQPLWMTSREAMAYVGNRSVNGFYRWRKRHGIYTDSMGRVSRLDLDRALRAPRKKRQMAAASLGNLRVPTVAAAAVVPDTNTPWLTSGQAVAYLALGSRRALQRAIDEHRLPYHRIGRRLRFFRPELDHWLLNTGSGSGSGRSTT